MHQAGLVYRARDVQDSPPDRQPIQNRIPGGNYRWLMRPYEDKTSGAYRREPCSWMELCQDPSAALPNGKVRGHISVPDGEIVDRVPSRYPFWPLRRAGYLELMFSMCGWCGTQRDWSIRPGMFKISPLCFLPPPSCTFQSDVQRLEASHEHHVRHCTRCVDKIHLPPPPQQLTLVYSAWIHTWSPSFSLQPSAWEHHDI